MKNLYKITIYNSISKKKKMVKLYAFNLYDAVDLANCTEVHHASEDIIKAELIKI